MSQPGKPNPPSPWLNADALLGSVRQLNIFCGGYGSGKTEVAVNFALAMAGLGREVSVADLDIVNPYFRSREVRAQLREQGIEVLVPGEELVNADLPVIQPEIRGAIESRRRTVVLDLGGDPVGARVMRSIAARLEPGSYSGFFVLNSRRPFTADRAGACRMMAEIEAASGLGITDIVVNSHLVDETTPEVIEEGIALAREVAAETGTRVAFVTIARALVGHFDAAACGCPVLVLDRRMLKPWEPSNWLGKYRISS